VRFADKCRACGLDYSSFNVGDGPAAFLIFIVGAVLVAERCQSTAPSRRAWWVHLVWIPIGVATDDNRPEMGKGAASDQEYPPPRPRRADRRMTRRIPVLPTLVASRRSRS
jgi:hypothetical protein